MELNSSKSSLKEKITAMLTDRNADSSSSKHQPPPKQTENEAKNKYPLLDELRRDLSPPPHRNSTNTEEDILYETYLGQFRYQMEIIRATYDATHPGPEDSALTDKNDEPLIEGLEEASAKH